MTDTNPVVINSRKLVELAYIRTELAAENTYLATMRVAFTLAIVATFTQKWFILGFSILLLLGALIQYHKLSKYLIVMNTSKKEDSEEAISRLANINKYVFIFYSSIFILTIIIEYLTQKTPGRHTLFK